MFLLKTKRLILREFQEADLESLHQKIFSDLDVMQFSDGVQTKEQTQEWLHVCYTNYQTRGFGAYAVIEQSSNQVIGYCGLFYFYDVNGKLEIEIGYRLARSAWGQGYGTEAAMAIKDFAFNNLKLSRLIALIDPDNIASIRVAEKLGMIYESDVMVEGYSHPDYVYAINKD